MNGTPAVDAVAATAIIGTGAALAKESATAAASAPYESSCATAVLVRGAGLARLYTPNTANAGAAARADATTALLVPLAGLTVGRTALRVGSSYPTADAY
jgi:hypothetical protein